MAKKRVSWSEISEEYRDELLIRKYEQEEDTYELAKEVGMRASTLGRRLREWKNERGFEPSEQVNMPGAPDENKVHVNYSDDDPNYMSVSTEGDRVRSIDDLLEHCKIDTEIWAVDNSDVKTWEGYRKDVDKELDFLEGRITGHVIDHGKINTKILYSVGVSLVRRDPIAVFPTLQPVRINVAPDVSFPDKVEFDTRLKNALIIPDIHAGFERKLTGELRPLHDRAALDIVLQFAQVFKFDRVIQIGDLLDLPDWSSRFIRSPEVEFTTQPALIEASWWLQMVQRNALENPEDMYVIEGNHDIRMEKEILTNTNSAHKLKSAHKLDSFPAMSIPGLLGFEESGMSWVGGYPDADVWLSDYLRAYHGRYARGNPGATVKAIFDKEGLSASTIFGHIHRNERASRVHKGRYEEYPITNFSPGFLGHIDYRIPGHKKNQHWQQGFAVVHYDPNSPEHYIEGIEINDGTAFYGGERWVAREETEEEIMQFLYEELEEIERQRS